MTDWSAILLDRETDAEDTDAIAEGLRRTLADVRASVEDFHAMRDVARGLADELESSPPQGLDAEAELGVRLLRWLADDHFTFLGYREYRLEHEGDDEVLRALPGTGFGILRADQDMSPSFGKLPGATKLTSPRNFVTSRIDSAIAAASAA